MSEKECNLLKDAFFKRYWGVKLWHNWVSNNLKPKSGSGVPCLTAASGQTRRFFGRPDEILTKAVAFEPQANTTYATNLAMYKLWTDKDNRVVRQGEAPHQTANVSLRIEPLHQVHDALCGQFKKSDSTWAPGKIKAYFNNPLFIAGQSIVIPYEGGFGPSWMELGTKYGGGEI